MRNSVAIFFIILALGSAAVERRSFAREYDAFSEEALISGLWDVTRLGVRSDNGNVSAGIGLSGTYSERAGGCEFLYLLRGDSLVYRGYTCGRGEGFINDSITLAWKRPFSPGIHQYYFTQCGKRGDISVSTVTEFESEVMGYGRFVRAVADTVPDVWLVREKHIVDERASGIAAGSYALEFYRWYAGSDSLPLAVQLSVAADGAESAALYISDCPYDRGSEYEESGTDYAAVLSEAEVTVDGAYVNIHFASGSDFETEAWLVDTSGHTYGYTRSSAGVSAREVHVPVTGLPRGSYMLVISVGDAPGAVEKRMLVL